MSNQMMQVCVCVCSKFFSWVFFPDGFQNGVAIETDFDDGSSFKTYIRFETFEKMKAWMLDIKNEAQNITFAEDDQADWWNALFNDVQVIEPKNAPRRDGVLGDADNG